MYARIQAKLLFTMEGGTVRVVLSRRGVQQGCNLGGLGFCIGLLDVLIAFNKDPPLTGAKLIAYIDDLVVLLPPALAKDIKAIATVTDWVRDKLEEKGVQLSLPKCKLLLSRGISL